MPAVSGSGDKLPIGLLKGMGAGCSQYGFSGTCGGMFPSSDRSPSFTKQLHLTIGRGVYIFIYLPGEI